MRILSIICIKQHINESRFLSQTDVWFLPQDFFDVLSKEFNFNLDPYVYPENAVGSFYVSKGKKHTKGLLLY